MSNVFTLWDPNKGAVPLEVAIAGTPFNPSPLVDPVFSGTIDGTAAKTNLSTTSIGMLTATQIAALQAGLQVSGGDTILGTTQIGSMASLQVGGLTTSLTAQLGCLTATQLSNSTSFTANGTTLVSIQVGTLTTTSVALFGLQTAGGTVGATPTVKSVDTATGKMTVAADAGDTSTYNVSVMG